MLCKHCKKRILFDEPTWSWFHPDPEAPNGMQWLCRLMAEPEANKCDST